MALIRFAVRGVRVSASTIAVVALPALHSAFEWWSWRFPYIKSSTKAT